MDLAVAPRWTVSLRQGEVLDDVPDYVKVGVGAAKCGGVERRGLSAHPPDGGITAIWLPMTLGPGPAWLRTWVGLRDGSTSAGVLFRGEVNGQEIVSRSMLPGSWERLEVDLARWRGQPVVRGLVTDADGSHSFDWAWWGEPRLEAGK